MNGWIIDKRSKPPDRWAIALRETGWKNSKWRTFRGTRREAQRYLRNVLASADRGDFIEPSKTTLGEFLTEWLQNTVEPSRSYHTCKVYRSVLSAHLLPNRIAGIRLQALTPSDIERYHREKADLSAKTCRLHHSILSSALKLAERDGLVRRNVARLATERPNRQAVPEQLKAWTAGEARKVLVAAKAEGLQAGALLALALDSGARRGELQGLRWSDLDLPTGVLRIERQLLYWKTAKPKAQPEAVFGPTKTRRTRSIDLSAETLALLREHKREQAEFKLANRTVYADHGLIFAQTCPSGPNRRVGEPLKSSMLTSLLNRLIQSASVRPITVHGLRHTNATLLLAAGVQPHVVQRRLGHSNIAMTLNQYAHVLPSQQQDAASRLAGLLYA
jgi:integrase